MSEVENLNKAVENLSSTVATLAANVHAAQLITVEAFGEIKGDIKALKPWVQTEISTRVASLRAEALESNLARANTSIDWVKLFKNIGVIVAAIAAGLGVGLGV